jgi:hypothetical protein
VEPVGKRAHRTPSNSAIDPALDVLQNAYVAPLQDQTRMVGAWRRAELVSRNVPAWATFYRIGKLTDLDRQYKPEANILINSASR